MRADVAPALVRGDAVRLQASLREVLAALIATAPEGARVTVRPRAPPAGSALELSATAGLGDEVIAAAQALLGPEGALIAPVAAPGSGAGRRLGCRITFPPVEGEEPAHRSPWVPRPSSGGFDTRASGPVASRPTTT